MGANDAFSETDAYTRRHVEAITGRIFRVTAAPITPAAERPEDATAVHPRLSVGACATCTCMTPTLLTTWTRYYICAACGRRWQVPAMTERQ
jgi:hypothetical protein